MSHSRRELLRLELPLAAVGIGVLAVAFVFAATGIPPLPAAPLVHLGIPSPLTGMTRSVVALAAGDLAASLRWHPLGPAVFAASAAAVVVAAASWIRGRRLDSLAAVLASRLLWTAVAGMFAVVWLGRIVVGGS